MKAQRIMGVDVGVSGAYAIIDTDFQILTFKEFSRTMKEICWDELIDDISKYDVSYVAIEKAQAMPQQGVCSMFSYGKVYGEILGVIKALRIPYFLVSPQTWKKAQCAGLPNEKGSSIIRVKELFPEFGSYEFLKRHHNVCDAILIARHVIITNALISK